MFFYKEKTVNNIPKEKNYENILNYTPNIQSIDFICLYALKYTPYCCSFKNSCGICPRNM